MRFSFIVPVYNASGTIRRCVESILANTFCDYEILLIDDCSKDDSLQKCREIAKNHSNIRVFHNEINKGVSHTRNVGLENAEGEYLLFSDSDDWIEPTYAECFDKALNQGAEFAVCGFYNHDEKYNKRLDTYKWSFIEENNTYPLLDQMDDLYRRTLFQQLWNKVFNNEIVQKNKLRFDESISIGEDFRFILHYLKAAEVNEIVLINQPLYHYMRDQAGSLMFHIGYESIEEPLRNKRLFYELKGLNESEINSLMSEERTKQEDLYAYLIFHNGDMKLAEKKRLIMNLSSSRGKELYRHNAVLYCKEKVSMILNSSKKMGPEVKKALIKAKRTVKEGSSDLKYFGLRTALAKNACVWHDESLSSVQNKNNVILEYLKNEYADVLEKYRDRQEPSADEPSENAPIWVFWWQGKNSMPEIIQLCHESKIRCSNGHPVILLDQNNIRDYVEFPEYIWEQFDQRKIRVQHLADMIRVSLIKKYGGLWLDASVFCHNPIPESVFKVPLFSLKGESMPEFVSDNQWTTFIIGGRKGNVLCSFLDEFFLAYCKNEKPFIDYFMFDCGIAMAYQNIPAVKRSIDSLEKTNGDVYWLNGVLNKAADPELLIMYYEEPSVFYKIAWKQEWKKGNTLYGYLLSEETGK